jgi:hypothetical protein
MYYNKKTFRDAIEYIKTNNDEFVNKSYQIEQGTYKYSLPDDLLVKNYTFSKEELCLRKEIVPIIYDLKIEKKSRKNLVSLSSFLGKKEVKEVLKATPV